MLKTEIAQLKEHLEAARSSGQRSSDLERILEEKEAETIQIKDQLDKRQSRLNALMEEINSKQETIDELKRVNATQLEDQNKLEQQIIEVGNSLMDYTTQIERLQAVLASRDDMINQLNSQLKERGEQGDKVTELEEAVLKAVERVKALKEELKQTQGERDAAIAKTSAEKEHDVENLTAELRDLRDDNETLKAENETLLAEVERTSRNSEQISKEIESLKKTLQTSEEELKVKSAELKVQVERVTEIESERDQVREELINLRVSELREAKDQLSTVEAKLREKDIIFQEKEDEITRLKAKLTSEEDRIQDFRQKLTKIEKERDEIEGLIPDHKAMQSELNRVVKSLGESREKIQELDGLLSERKTQIGMLEEEVNELSSREERFEDILDDLKRYLSENPKYQILFVLSDLKTTGTNELSKAIGRPIAVTRALVKGLEGEGWVSVEGEKVTIEKDFLDV